MTAEGITSRLITILVLETEKINIQQTQTTEIKVKIHIKPETVTTEIKIGQNQGTIEKTGHNMRQNSILEANHRIDLEIINQTIHLEETIQRRDIMILETDQDMKEINPTIGIDTEIIEVQAVAVTDTTTILDSEAHLDTIETTGHFQGIDKILATGVILETDTMIDEDKIDTDHGQTPMEIVLEQTHILEIDKAHTILGVQDKMQEVTVLDVIIMTTDLEHLPIAHLEDHRTLPLTALIHLEEKIIIN